jgi:TonB-linked SusC/RagA family outer membrane protein
MKKAKFKHVRYHRFVRISLLLMFSVVCSVAVVRADAAEEESVSQAAVTVTGVVSDAHGDPLPGAIVRLVDGATAASTGADGRYSITVPGQTAVLSFAYMGYTTQQVAVGNRTVIDVVLQEDAREIDEVVVIGYGTARKRDLVGAVGHLDGKALVEKSAMNISRSLQGMVPGLNISMQDGKPSRGASLTLRGMGSVGAGGGALILIDGAEAHGDLTTVNPADIESVSVLKDASSAAIYGAKGAFGVILITTKNPAKGKPKVNYNGSMSAHRRLFEPDRVTNGLEWTDGFYKAYLGGKGTAPNSINNVFKFNADWYAELVKRNADPTLEKVRVNKNGLYEYFGNTDWFDVIYKDFNLSQEHNLSVSGGDDRIKYYVSGRYFNQDGIYTAGDEDYTQYNFRAKGSLKINRQLTLDNNTDFIRRSIHQPMVMYDRQLILRQLEHQGYPMTMPKNPDGTWTETAVYTGWAGFVEGTSYQHNNKFDLKNTSTLTYTPWEELTLKADFSYYFNRSERDRAENMYKYYTGPAVSATRNTFSSLDHASYANQYEASNVTAGYVPKFADNNHRLNLLGGINVEHKKTTNITTYRRGLLLPEKPTFNLMDGEYYTVGQSGNEWSYFGLLYRANYNYKDTYLLEVSGRYDGSSKFPSNQRWGFFPSASIGWRLSEEKFMDWSNDFLDNLKIRLSAGSLGNGSVDPFKYISMMDVKRSGVIIGDGLQTYTYAPANTPESLTWETSTTYDAGLDIDLLGNRLNLIIDYFRRYTTDMYTVGPELPAVFGASSPYGNNADMKTTGWELTLQWRDHLPLAGRPFNYFLKAMLWDDRSWITKYNNPQKNLGSGHTASYYEGMEIGEIWGYHVEGLFHDQAEIDNHADQSAIRVSDANILQPGDLKYADLDNSRTINSGANTVDNPGDRRIIGNSSARYRFGFNLGANWNGFGVNAFIQGIGKKDWYPYQESAFFWGQYNRPYSYMLKIHTGENVYSDENGNFNAYWPRYRGYLANSANSAMRTVNDRYLQNVAYVRLKSLQIDYTFGRNVCDLLHLSELRIYVAGDNLFTWSPLFKVTRNYDPELINAGDSDFRSTAGTDGDGYGYPMQSAWTLGVSLTF